MILFCDIASSFCFAWFTLGVFVTGNCRVLLMPHSHHSHSGQFCKHASGSLEDVVAEAIKKGFEVYGLTEHVPRYRAEDLYPEEVCSSLSPSTPRILT